MQESNYGKKQLKKSLYAFIVGKVLSSAIGIALILLVVRYLDIPNYSAYISLIALMEIVHLFSNFGAFAAAYRYVPLLYSQHRYHQLSSLLIQLTKYRFLVLVVIAWFIYFLIGPLVKYLNIADFQLEASLFLIAVVFEGQARYIDIILDSLLMQKKSQTLVVTRNGLRLFLLIGYNAISENFELINVVHIELIASFVGAALSCYFILQISKQLNETQDSLVKPTQANGKVITSNKYIVTAYLSELTSIFTGVEFGRMALSRVGSLVEVAAFGFVSSVFLSVRRYIPVFLFQGMIRPLFIDIVHHNKGQEKLSTLTNVIFKINLHLLIPILISTLLYGDSLVAFLSGGKFKEEGLYLILFLILLISQMLHSLIGFILVAYEDSKTQFTGLVMGVLIVFLSYSFYQNFKVASMIWGLIFAESTWALYALMILAKKKIHLSFDHLNLVKMFFVSLSIILMMSVGNFDLYLSETHVLLKCCIVTLIYYCLTALVKIFRSEERALINSMLPKALCIW